MMGQSIDWTDEAPRAGGSAIIAPEDRPPALGLFDPGAWKVGFDLAETGPDTGANKARYETEIGGKIWQALRDKGYQVDARGMTTADQVPATVAQARQSFYSALADARRRYPGFLGDYGDVTDLDSLKARALKDQKADAAKASFAAQGLTFGGHLAAFGGGVGASYDDPETYLGMLPGGSAVGTVGRQILMTGLRDAAINAGIGVASEPFVRQSSARLGIDRSTGDTLYDIGLQGTFGFLFGTTMKSAELGIPHAGDAFATAREKALTALYPNLPESVQRRWASSATLGDRLLTESMRQTIGADRLTPDERSAIHVLQANADVRDASPFVPSEAGDALHADRASATMAAILAGDPVPDYGPALSGAGTRAALLSGTSKFSGVADAADRIISSESGGNATAHNPQPGQTASGLGQFTDTTWLAMAREHPELFPANATPAQILRAKTDPKIGRQMTEIAVAGYKDALERQGLPVTDGNLYLMHFLGPREASEILHAAPTTPIAALLPEHVIAANESVLRGRSAGELTAWTDSRMGGSGELPRGAADLSDDRTIDTTAENVPEPASASAQPPSSGSTFDPAPMLDDFRRYVRETREPLTADALARNFDIDATDAQRLLGFAASSPDSGIVVDRRGVVRRRPTRRGPVDLITWIADNGGIVDSEGHNLVNGRNLQTFVPGAGPLIRKSGRTIDELGELLWERGWFGKDSERPTTSQVLDLIENAHRDKLYPPEERLAAGDAQRQAESDAAEQQARDSIRAFLGKEADKLSPDIEQAALDHMARGRGTEEALTMAMIDHADNALRSLGVETESDIYDIPGFDDEPFHPTLSDPFAEPAAPDDRGAGNRRAGQAGEPGNAGAGAPGTEEPSPAAGDHAIGEPGGSALPADPDGRGAGSLDPQALKQFDDPAGKGAAQQTASLEHDLRMAAGDEAAAKGTYRLDAEGGDRSVDDILSEIEADEKAAAALRGCMKPGGGNGA